VSLHAQIYAVSGDCSAHTAFEAKLTAYFPTAQVYNPTYLLVLYSDLSLYQINIFFFI
jgi:hypothetical protein